MDIQQIFTGAISLSAHKDDENDTRIGEFLQQLQTVILNDQSDLLRESIDKLVAAQENRAVQFLISAILFLSSHTLLEDPQLHAQLLWIPLLVELPAGQRLPVLNRQQRHNLALAFHEKLSHHKLLSLSVQLRFPISPGTLRDVPEDFSAHRHLLDTWAARHDDPGYIAFPLDPTRSLPISQAVRNFPMLLPVLLFDDSAEGIGNPLEDFSPFQKNPDLPVSLSVLDTIANECSGLLESELHLSLQASVPLAFEAALDVLGLQYHQRVLAVLRAFMEEHVPDVQPQTCQWEAHRIQETSFFRIFNGCVSTGTDRFFFPLITGHYQSEQAIQNFLRSGFPELPEPLPNVINENGLPPSETVVDHKELWDWLAPFGSMEP